MWLGSSVEACRRCFGSEKHAIFQPPRGILLASHLHGVASARPVDTRVVVAPPLVSSEDLTSERTATPERAWASGLTLARSGSTSLGQSRARSYVCSPTRRGQGHPAAGAGEG